MATTSIRTFGTASVAAGLLGAAALLAPAFAAAQPIAPSDIIKIDSPELTVNVQGDAAHFTVSAPDGMACVGPLIVEGSIDADDIDPENIDEAFFEDLFDEAIWPTEEADLHIVVNESSPLADQPGASVSPLKVSVPNLNDGAYVATSLCVTDDSVTPYGAADQLSTFQSSQFPLQMHLRNFTISTSGSVNLGSADVFGSLGSLGS